MNENLVIRPEVLYQKESYVEPLKTAGLFQPVQVIKFFINSDMCILSFPLYLFPDRNPSLETGNNKKKSFTYS